MSKLAMGVLNFHLVALAIITVLIVLSCGNAQASQSHLRRTVGRFLDMSCSSKDCVVYVKPLGKEEKLFIMNGENGHSMNNVGALRYKDRMVELISYKNKLRGDLEMVKSIRFVD